MKKWLCFLCVCLLFTHCSRREKNIIPKRDLVPILIDMHVADAIGMNQIISNHFGGLDSAMLYDAVLMRHGYTKDDFIKTLGYYSAKPDVLVKIYNDVFSELTKMSEKAKAEYNKTTTSRTKLIWKPEVTRYKITGDTGSYPQPFDVEIDTTGTFALSVNMKITPADSSLNPRIMAYFYKPGTEEKIYFEEVPLLKSEHLREYVLIREIRDKDYSRLNITIPMHDTQDSLFMKYFEVQDIRVTLLRQDEKN